MRLDDLQAAIEQWRMAEVAVAYEALARWLTTDRLLLTLDGVPEGAVVLAARAEPTTRELVLQIAHPSLPLVLERGVLPRLQVVTRDGRID